MRFRRLLFRRSLSLRSHLTVLVLVAVLPVLILAVVLFRRDVQLQRNAVEGGMRNTARALSLAIDREVGTVRSMLETLAASPALDSGDLKSFYELSSRAAQQRKGSWIVLFDRSGQQIVNTLRPFGSRLPNPFRDARPAKPADSHPRLPLGAPEPVRTAIETGKLAVSDLFIALDSRRPTIGINIPVIRRGQVLYALEMAMPPESLTALLREQQLPPDWFAAIVDRSGIILARTLDPERLVGQPIRAEQRMVMAKSDEGWDSRTSLENIVVDYAFTRSKLTGWTIDVAASQPAIYAPVNRSIRIISAGAALLLMLALGLAFALARRISTPISNLATSAEGIQRGEQIELKSSAVTEVAHLHEALLQAGAGARIAEAERERRLIAETKQKEADAAKQQVTNILESMSDGFSAFDPEWRFSYINGKAHEELARQYFERDDLLGEVLWEVFPQQVGTRWYDALQRAMRERVPVTCEFHYSPLDEWYEDRVSPMPDGGIGIYRRNITDHKLTERRLAAHLAITQILAESPSLHEATPRILEAIGQRLSWEVADLWTPDSEGMVLRCAKVWHDPAAAVERFVSASQKLTFAPGMGLPGGVWTSLKPRWIPDLAKDENFPRAPFAAEAGLHAGFAFPILFGQKFFGVMEFFSHQSRQPDDSLLLMFAGIGGQIGQFMERKRADQVLAEQARLLDSSNEAILVLDAQRRVTYWNKGAEEDYGYTRDEALGQVAHELMQTKFPAPLERLNERLYRDGRWFGELTHTRKDGLTIVVASRWSLNRDAQGNPASILETNRDITARKHAEQALEQAARQKEALYQFVERRQRAASLREMYDAALDAILSALSCERASILLSDVSGIMGFVASRGLSNAYCKAVEGHSPWKAEETNPTPLCLADVAAAELDESLKAVIAGEGISALAFIPLVVNGKLAGKFMTYYDEPHVFHDEELELSLTIARQLALGIERKRAEDKIAQLNGELERRVAERTRELHKANAALLRDIDERKKLEAQLLQAQKMESIGTLAGGVAHDFNNILNIIQAYASVLTAYRGHNQEIDESVTVINDTVKRGSSLVQQLLTVARKSGGAELELVNPNVLIEGLLPLIREIFPKAIELSCSLTPDLPPIMGDKNQIEQALLNLCVNSRDAMPHGGKLTFGTQSVDGAALQPLSDPEQRYVCIEVNDAGLGIDESIRERIFEPFFTTKDKTQGTGLGLSIVYGIVKKHNGFVEVESKPLAGASFRLYFPTAPIQMTAKEPAIATAAATTSTSNGAGTVLLVEDEASMLYLLEKLFLRRGYKVLKANDGQAALDIFQQHKEEIDVVLLDVGLPKISGRDVLLKMRNENAKVKVIVTSGYIEPEMKLEIDRAGARFIPKPYTAEDVVQALQTLIESVS